MGKDRKGVKVLPPITVTLLGNRRFPVSFSVEEVLPKDLRARKGKNPKEREEETNTHPRPPDTCDLTLSQSEKRKLSWV